MKKNVVLMIVFVLIGGFVWAGELESLYQKLPENTFGFAATSGTDNFEGDFQGSTLGQIAADPQVKTFFEQLMTSVSKAKGFQEFAGQGDDYVGFVKGVLATPTVLAMVPLSDNFEDEPCGLLLSEAIDADSSLGKLFLDNIKKLEGTQLVRKEVGGHEIYVSNDPNCSEPYYILSSDDVFMIGFNDAQFAMLEHLASNAANTELSEKISRLPSAGDAFVLYVDFQKFMTMIKAEAESDIDAQQALDLFQALGLDEIQEYVIKAGFEGKNLVMDAKIQTPVSGGIFDAIGTVDKGLFNYVDAKAMQASAVYLNPALLYDTIISGIEATGSSAQPQVEQIEKMLGFKLRDELLANLDGSFMGYMLPAYASPELLTGGYVLVAELKDAEKFQSCMMSLETLVGSMAPSDQLQITSQKTAAGKDVHIWAVGVAAMMQIIPSWAIEGETLLITSHPNLTTRMMDRIHDASLESLISKPEFSSAMDRIPADAFAMSLTDSKAQARQVMKMLQQYWPMLNMGLMQEGIQLPIMLPSIEAYIAQMEPGMSYTQKTTDGIVFHYEGTGLEASSGGAAGGAMGMAILMPALSRVKRVSEKVVCGTNLKGLGTALIVYTNDYDDILPSENWCDALIEEADVSPKSFVCPQSDAIEGESSYAMNKNLLGKNMGKLPPNLVLLFETNKGIDEGPRNTSIEARRHYKFLNSYNGHYNEDTLVYKDCFNQAGGPEDVVLHHKKGQRGCNILFVDGHVEFVTQDRISDLHWTVE